MATLIEPFVKLLVQSPVIVEPFVTVYGGVERVDKAVERVGIQRRHSFGSQLSSARLEHRTHFKNIFDFVRFQRYDIKSTARLELN